MPDRALQVQPGTSSLVNSDFMGKALASYEAMTIAVFLAWKADYPLWCL
jgi:hypothetical protein